jgi:hypothetical protein
MANQPYSPIRWKPILLMTLLVVVWAFHDRFSPPTRPWGHLLDDISVGRVFIVSYDADVISVLGKGSGDDKETYYTVDYPGGALIVAYNLHRPQDNMAVLERGVPAKGLLVVILPWAVLAALILLMVRYAFFRDGVPPRT